MDLDLKLLNRRLPWDSCYLSPLPHDGEVNKPSLHKASLRLSPAWQRAPPPPWSCPFSAALLLCVVLFPACHQHTGAYCMANAAPSFKIM